VCTLGVSPDPAGVWYEPKVVWTVGDSGGQTLDRVVCTSDPTQGEVDIETMCLIPSRREQPTHGLSHTIGQLESRDLCFGEDWSLGAGQPYSHRGGV